jgi:thiol-disulfide isomerase/thioredoxin
MTRWKLPCAAFLKSKAIVMIKLATGRMFLFQIIVLLAHFAGVSATPVDKKHQGEIRVIIFADTECPVSQSYMLELRKLATEYAARNVKFEMIFPVATATESEIKAFLKKYNIPFRGYPDKDRSRARRYRATVMPEAVVLNSQGAAVYQGAIDNWYVSLGKNRPKATEFYLRNAIEATLNGNPVLVRRTTAIGCLIND